MQMDVQAGIPVHCASCEARNHGLCGALMPDELTSLAATSVKHRAEPGRELITEAMEVDRFSNVLNGVVKLTKMLSDGRQQIVGLQFAPDFVGRPFLNESTVTAEAATEVSLCSFPRRALESMMHRQPDFERRLLNQTAKELDQARDWMVMLGRKSASEKVATFIQMISQHIAPRDVNAAAISFDLPLSRSDIADFLGLTIETVSRQFTKLRTEGVISIDHSRRLTIVNAPALLMRVGS